MTTQSLSATNNSDNPANEGRKPEVLRLENLSVYYDTPRGPVHAVEDVSFSLYNQERLGLAGESGSGKSSMVLTIMRLLKPPARIASGNIWLEDTDLLSVPEPQMKALRLAQVALIAQGSMNSLNPVMRIRDQIGYGLKDHGIKLSKRELQERVTPPPTDPFPEWGLRLKWQICIHTS